MDSAELRRRVREGRDFVDVVEAFIYLVQQPDLTWQDLLDGLDHRGVIAETAMIRLHNALRVAVPASGLISKRSVWERVLAERSLSGSDIVPAPLQNGDTRRVPDK